MMRRNSITFLKYLIGITILMTTGVFLLHGVIWMTQGNHLNLRVKARVDLVDVIPVDTRTIKHRSGEHIEESSKPEKIDWHDYEAIEKEKNRRGPGEQGSPVRLSEKDEGLKRKLYSTNGFNALVSDKISLQRSIRDIRHKDCSNQTYLKHLPSVSFILPFYNEHLSVLLRSVYSIINRAPKQLVKEIILADDFSYKEETKQPLDDYIKEHFDNVIVVRGKKREGLIRNRMMGARLATGDVFIFLDSHIECNINFLPPLLDPIAENYRTVVCPFIDIIDYESFKYKAQDDGARGAFDWNFNYKRLPLLVEDRKHPTRPFNNPVMAGGLFAISKDWFWELGGYDPGLDIWGGEQYELSFKIWQCGGKMVDAPCSRIGHIYRKHVPFSTAGFGDYRSKNYKRVAEVWMDEYAEYLYKRCRSCQTVDPGDISEQKKIREKLKCKSFKWFMEEIAFDLPKFYPPVELPPFAEGEIRNIASNLCIDYIRRRSNRTFELHACPTGSENWGIVGPVPRFVFTWRNDIRILRENRCFDVTSNRPKIPLALYACHGRQGNQKFKYHLATQHVYHPGTNQCLDSDGVTLEIFMNPCNDDSNSQKWTFEGYVNKDRIMNDIDIIGIHLEAAR